MQCWGPSTLSVPQAQPAGQVGSQVAPQTHVSAQLPLSKQTFCPVRQQTPPQERFGQGGVEVQSGRQKPPLAPPWPHPAIWQCVPLGHWAVLVQGTGFGGHKPGSGIQRWGPSTLSVPQAQPAGHASQFSGPLQTQVSAQVPLARQTSSPGRQDMPPQVMTGVAVVVVVVVVGG